MLYFQTEINQRLLDFFVANFKARHKRYRFRIIDVFKIS